MRLDHFHQVTLFNERVLQVRRPPAPSVMSADAAKMTITMLREEAEETIGAMMRGDILQTADGLGDLIVVAMGAMHRMGINADEVLTTICASNLTKKPGMVPVRGVKHDAIKDGDYEPPMIEDAVGANTKSFPMPNVFVECARMQLLKSEDYNGVNEVEESRDRYWLFGFNSIVQMIWTKTLRVCSLAKQRRTQNYEGLVDNLLDLINYACFGVEWLLDSAEKEAGK